MKILCVRFSSIGDIILCTPIFRVLRKSGHEVHVLTKGSFASVLGGNPNIEKVHLYEEAIQTDLRSLKNEEFDLAIDLHKNLRSKRLLNKLAIRSLTFDKINIQKWLAVNFKWSVLPEKHLVDRYFEGISELGLENDGNGLDFVTEELGPAIMIPSQFVAIALGAAHATKAMTTEMIRNICQRLTMPVVLLGGPGDKELGLSIATELPNVVNMAGESTIRQSGEIIARSALLITPDTGLMHIGAALKKRMIVVWGNTVPEFGMFPYYGNHHVEHFNSQVVLSCRPCSKIGYAKCPKGHFNCMKKQDLDRIIELVNEWTVDES